MQYLSKLLDLICGTLNNKTFQDLTVKIIEYGEKIISTMSK